MQPARFVLVLVCLALVGFAGLTATTTFGNEPTSASGQPNVLVLITDEHNFRTLGCYRALLAKEQAEMWGPGAVVETPNLDRLANEGVICTRAYATAPVCTPCRAAMITGLYPHQTGAPANDLPLRDDVPTAAKLFRAAGYETTFIGKWHLGGSGKPEWSPKVNGGFEHTRFMFNRGHWKKLAIDDGVPSVGATDAKGRPSYNVDGADEKTFATDYLTDRAIEFFDDMSDKRFFAVISYPDPHGPNTVRTPYDHQYDHLRFLPPRTYGQDDLPKPKWLSGNAKKHPKFLGKQMGLYFGMVKCIDDNVGRLLASLERSGRLDNTIVLMTSDHGDLCFEHDRQNKGNPYEGSARVPFLVRFPSKLAAKTVYTGPVGTVDVTPTLLSLANVPESGDSEIAFEGRDLSDALAGQGPHPPELTFLRNAGTKCNWVAAVDSRFKLILSVSDRPWLFDQETDPDELHNQFGRPGTKEIVKRLATELSSYGVRTKDPFFENEAIQAGLKQCLSP